MFETAEVGNRLDKKAFEREALKLRPALLSAQKELAAANLSLVLVIAGNEGAGKGETVNLLLEWLDARGVQVHALWDPTDEERERPPMWRFWRLLPPRGRIGILFGSWYTQPILDRVFHRLSRPVFDVELERIVDLEQMLVRENTLIVKFWLHLSKRAQKKRLARLEKDPETAWRVTPMDWKFFRRYDRFRKVSEQTLRRTSTSPSPWHIVEAEDDHWRAFTVVSTLLNALRERLAAPRAPRPKTKAVLPRPAAANVINRLDYGRKMSDREYDRKLPLLQGRINRLTRRLHERKRSLLLVFEGADAAGKGGTIRRITYAIDARAYQVMSVAAPTDEERAHPYLWRFWRALPRLGRVTIYDRSWYGRVLVERVEGFCAPDDWQRAYTEINDFERQLTDHGTIVLKFWLATTSAEQLRRFKDRELTPYKQYKITEEDWRNRAKWDAYEAAACDMIERTGTADAPWILVEANDKRWARIRVLRAVVQRLEKELG